MQKWTIAVASIMFIAVADSSHAKSTTFSSVPANIADAPVDRWIGVERADQYQMYQWRVRIPNGMILVSRTWNGIYWPESMFSSKDSALEIFRQAGLDNFRRIESTASHRSRWGYMAMGKYKSTDCIAGVSMDRNDHHHDGPDGGNLRRFVLDCGRNAESRYGDWGTWLRSFKQAPEGYNAKLD